MTKFCTVPYLRMEPTGGPLKEIVKFKTNGRQLNKTRQE